MNTRSTNYIIDAIEKNDETVLRIACVRKTRVLASKLQIGIDPIVEIDYDVCFINYV